MQDFAHCISQAGPLENLVFKRFGYFPLSVRGSQGFCQAHNFQVQILPPQPTTVILNNIYSHLGFEVAFYIRALLALCKTVMSALGRRVYVSFGLSVVSG